MFPVRSYSMFVDSLGMFVLGADSSSELCRSFKRTKKGVMMLRRKLIVSGWQGLDISQDQRTLSKIAAGCNVSHRIHECYIYHEKQISQMSINMSYMDPMGLSMSPYGCRLFPLFLKSTAKHLGSNYYALISNHVFFFNKKYVISMTDVFPYVWLVVNCVFQVGRLNGWDFR